MDLNSVIVVFRVFIVAGGIGTVIYLWWHLTHQHDAHDRAMIQGIMVLTSVLMLQTMTLIYFRWKIVHGLDIVNAFDSSISMASTLLVAGAIIYVFERVRATLKD